MVNVLWQDGTREVIDCKETVPYVNPDEYDCWYVMITLFLIPFFNFCLTIGPATTLFGKAKMASEQLLYSQ